MSVDLLGPASAPNAVTVRPTENRTFGSADSFFRDCSSPTLDDGTELQAAFINQLLASARSLARGNGNLGGGSPVVTEDNTDDAVILKAVQYLIQRGQVSYADDTGTADALVVTMAPAPPEYKKGIVVWFKKSAAANATTTPTINVNGLGATTIVKRDGSAVVAADFAASGFYGLIHDGTTFRSVTALPSDSLSSQQIKTLIFSPNIVKFTTPGAFSWTVPAGITIAKIIAWGGGGGGGFSAASGGSGGGGGGYGEQAVTVTPAGTLSGAVAAGGAAATTVGANGSGGGSTTVTNSTDGTTYTAAGGTGGHSGDGTNGSVSGGSLTNFVNRALVGQPSGGTIDGYSGSAILPYAGNGGAAALGGVPGLGGTGGGNSGNAPGSGGAGSGSSQPAGAGARGEVWILY